MTDLETVESPSVIWATLEHANCARHRNYALSCAQFDALLERAAGHCEICGAESQPQIKGCCLYIDHEHFVGQWAVRGLLCYVCNLAMSSNRRVPPEPRIKQYIANAWYVQELKAAGLSEEPLPEPGPGSRVAAGNKHWARYTGDKEASWFSSNYNTTSTKTWQQLWYQYGPFNVRILEIHDEPSKYLLDDVRRHAPYLLPKATKRPPKVAAVVLEERIGRARAVIAAGKWHESDRELLAKIESILTGGR